ncbi:MAG: aminotransferase class I/II-fold pyridoxal phosphate-dependent enzyme, partial [Myxococcales bacterium]
EVIPPQGAIYLSVRFLMPQRTNEQIRKLLLDEAGFAVVPFQAFGLQEDSGWFRISIGAVSLADIDAALPRVREVLARLAAG